MAQAFMVQSRKGTVGNFRLRAVLGMLSLCHPACEERESNHGELQRGPFPEGHYLGRCAVVRGLSVELPPCRRADAGTWGVRRPRDDQSLGPEVQPPTGSGVPPPQTPSLA